MEKFNQQIVWVELNVDNVKQNLERQQAIQKSKKQNWNNCKKNSYCRCSERFHKIYSTGKERGKSAMQIFFGNLKLDLQYYLKEFPLPRERSPRATAFECTDMIELQSPLVFILIFWLMHLVKVQSRWQDKKTIPEIHRKKYQFAKCSGDDTYCRLRPLLRKWVSI